MTAQKYYEHTCKCGCGNRLEIKRHHKYSGIPKFIKGHNCSGLVRGDMSDAHKSKISEAKKATPVKYWEGKSRSLETKDKISNKMLGNIPWNKNKPQIKTSGENNPNWKGGITNKNKIARTLSAYKDWRNEVFIRDDWTCRKCNNRGNELHPHHIFNFAESEEMRFDTDNGLTLCAKCHIKFHNIYGYTHNNFSQANNFIGVSDGNS